MKIATLLFALIAATPAGRSGGPVLLDFHASWCGPCRQMRPAVEQLIQNGYPVQSVDIDESPQLAARYHVTSVPTFVVVDASGRALARTSGAQPAAQLASLYREAKAKARVAPPDTIKAPVADDDSDEDAHDPADADEDGDDRPAPADEGDRPHPRPTNPHPWETVVRIKIYGQGAVGFGSGTIIQSTPKEAIILTCAHIFKLDGPRQAHPSRFPNKIVVDLFDGRLSGPQQTQVHYANESYEGEALDYDFGLDVGLIRIRPNRRLPASRVVPPHWHPQARMAMITVGCSEGHDATAWSTTILNPNMRGLSGSANYEAIECWHAPKQGRSGGGLYTTDGYVAGVCDFAEPRGNHGLYASPTSIYRLLDRNKLTALYAPASKPGDALLAENRPSPKRGTIARGQSPDGDEPDDVTIPPPELLGIKSPRIARREASGSRGRPTGWVPTPRPTARASEESGNAERTDLKLDPAADGDAFAPMPADASPASGPEVDTPKVRRSAGKWRAAQPASPGAEAS